MQMHIVNSFEFIEEHLPQTYVDLVAAKLAESGGPSFSNSVIRNVKAKGANAFRSNKHLPILTALVEVAKDNKKSIEDFLNSSSHLNTEKP